MAIIDKLYRNNMLSKTPSWVKDMSDDELNQTIAQMESQNSQAMKQGIASSVGDLGNIFLQKGGLRPIERKSKDNDINDFIMKELLKQQLKENDPLYQKKMALLDAKLNTPKDPKENILQVIAGMKKPEELQSGILAPEEIPLSVGSAEGGEVIATPGQNNEYLPGYEPKPFNEAVPGVLSKKFGVTPVEASRKSLGISKGEDIYKNIDVLVKELIKNNDYGGAKLAEAAQERGESPEEIYKLLEIYMNAPDEND